jgi:DNA invertase Pin-like site-specific DNA recombinase
MIAKAPRAYSYVRASTLKQDISPDAQKATIEAQATALGLVIDACFQDLGESGGKRFDQRPEGRNLCEQLAHGDHLFVAKLDRAFRNTVDCLTMVECWKKLGVKLHFCDLGAMPIDPTTPIGEFILTIMAAVAKLEREFIRQRTREALALRKRKGHCNGLYPGYGFAWRKQWDPKQQKTIKVRVPCPEERAVMKSIVGWRLEGQSFDAIRQHVQYELRLLTKDGREWSRARIVRAFLAELELQKRETEGAANE